MWPVLSAGACGCGGMLIIIRCLFFYSPPPRHHTKTHTHAAHTHTRPAVTLAMSRDGSSGGVVRIAVITKDGVERIFTPGDKLPTFWEG